MIRLILISILTFTSVSAIAKWTFIGYGMGGEMSVYVDLSSIRKTNSGTRMWYIGDFKTPVEVVVDKGKSFLSVRNLKEFDCEQNRTRYLSTMNFRGNMARGDAIFRNDEISQWFYVAPDSVDEALWKVVCDNK